MQDRGGAATKLPPECSSMSLIVCMAQYWDTLTLLIAVMKQTPLISIMSHCAIKL